MAIEWELARDDAREFEVGDSSGAVWGQDEYIVTRAEAAAEYGGPYSVAPTFEAITLETDGLMMTDDVSVGEIPVYEVSNQFGTTVTIG